MAWLGRSRQAGHGEGVRSFHPVTGWGPSRPSVTGEVVLALFDHARVVGDRSSFERGPHMAEWLLGLVDDE